MARARRLLRGRRRLAASRTHRRGPHHGPGPQGQLPHVRGVRSGHRPRPPEPPRVQHRQRDGADDPLRTDGLPAIRDDPARSRQPLAQAVGPSGRVRVRVPFDEQHAHVVSPRRIRQLRHDPLCRPAPRRRDPEDRRGLRAPGEAPRGAREHEARHGHGGARGPGAERTGRRAARAGRADVGRELDDRAGRRPEVPRCPPLGRVAGDPSTSSDDVSPDAEPHRGPAPDACRQPELPDRAGHERHRVLALVRPHDQ